MDINSLPIKLKHSEYGWPVDYILGRSIICPFQYARYFDSVELNLLYKKPTLNHSTSKINK